MARFSKIGLLVTQKPEIAKTVLELVISQEPTMKAAAVKLNVSTQTLRKCCETVGISVKAEDVDLDAFVSGLTAGYAAPAAPEAPEAPEAPAAAPAAPAKGKGK